MVVVEKQSWGLIVVNLDHLCPFLQAFFPILLALEAFHIGKLREVPLVVKSLEAGSTNAIGSEP